MFEIWKNQVESGFMGKRKDPSNSPPGHPFYSWLFICFSTNCSNSQRYYMRVIFVWKRLCACVYKEEINRSFRYNSYIALAQPRFLLSCCSQLRKSAYGHGISGHLPPATELRNPQLDKQSVYRGYVPACLSNQQIFFLSDFFSPPPLFGT